MVLVESRIVNFIRSRRQCDILIIVQAFQQRHHKLHSPGQMTHCLMHVAEVEVQPNAP